MGSYNIFSSFSNNFKHKMKDINGNIITEEEFMKGIGHGTSPQPEKYQEPKALPDTHSAVSPLPNTHHSQQPEKLLN